MRYAYRYANGSESPTGSILWFVVAFKSLEPSVDLILWVDKEVTRVNKLEKNVKVV